MRLALMLWVWCGVAGAACSVDYCYDGDTCWLGCPERVKVRFSCADAPEMAQKPWGAESRDWLNTRLPSGSVVELEYVSTDHNQRPVVVVLHNGDNVNLELAEAGMAAIDPRFCRKNPLYRAAELAAMAEGRGIWREPGPHQIPWAFRRAKAKAVNGLR